ncbi:MAG: 2-succinylbenzoate--CoA ligase [Hormoscilla sp. SP12CHS1]|nr:2-succinylbenzoate--CoA ligase [Hormoscilla sp. SP12CHS1]
MGQSLKELWQKRLVDHWLISDNSHQFTQLSQELFEKFAQQDKPPVILLAEAEPVKFIAGFIAAVAANCPVFLCNPHWVEREWQQVFHLVQPDLILGQPPSFPFPTPTSTPTSTLRSQASPGNEGGATGTKPACAGFENDLYLSQIMIPTGGSSGKIRFAIHTWETLMASVKGFQQYFGKTAINSFCVLPLDHVSGLMQCLRSFTTGGKLVIRPFKSIAQPCARSAFPSDGNNDVTNFFISLVPTQLQRLLEKHSSWLSRFETVLLGGGPAWNSLLSTARNYNIPLALTYGMTETASGIVTLKPADFLAGNNSCGRVLPHAQVTITGPDGERLDVNQTGAIAIDAESLTLGYYGQTKSAFSMGTDDIGYFDPQGYLHIVGRQSHKIITGGENVFPAEVEAALLATQLVSDVCAIGLPDVQWGEVVTVVYVPKSDRVSIDRLQRAIADKLSKYKRPKHWVAVDSLPRNGQGKVNRELLGQIALAKMQT